MPSSDIDTTTVESLKSASNVLIITGAGISAESGVPTFRDADGLWTKYDPEELATPEGFFRDPARAWEWYDMRRRSIVHCKPNPAHIILAKMERAYPRFLISTQNIDDLHEAAESKNVIGIHGSIWRMRCTVDEEDTWEDRNTPIPHIPPVCPRCGALARPDVVFFGEEYGREFHETYDFIKGGVDVTLVIGTSGYVATPHILAEEARRVGAYTVEINLEPTGFSKIADDVLIGKAGEILPDLWKTVDSI